MSREVSVSKTNFYNLHFSNDLQVIINPESVNLIELKKYINSKNKVICLNNGALRINLENNMFNIRGVKFDKSSYFISENSSDTYSVKFNNDKSDIILTLKYYMHLNF